MFIEPHIRGEKRGWIEVICGSMFSGKTEELIRRLRRAKIAHLKTEIFKPSMDTRYHQQNIVSHDENAIQSTPVDNSQTILLLANEVDVIGIDEAQFFEMPERDGDGRPAHLELSAELMLVRQRGADRIFGRRDCLNKRIGNAPGTRLCPSSHLRNSLLLGTAVIGPVVVRPKVHQRLENTISITRRVNLTVV